MGYCSGGLISIAYREGFIERMSSFKFRSIRKSLDWFFIGAILILVCGYLFILGNEQFLFHGSMATESGNASVVY